MVPLDIVSPHENTEGNNIVSMQATEKEKVKKLYKKLYLSKNVSLNILSCKQSLQIVQNVVPHSCRSVQPKVNCSQSPVPPSQILVSFVTFGFTHYFFPDNLNYISHPSVKDSAVPAVFIFPHTEEMLHRHALLSIKDVFLKSVTLKIITPLLHSSFSTDSINPSLSGEDDDDTETATIQKEVASTLTLKD